MESIGIVFRKQATKELLERNKRALVNMLLMFGRMAKAYDHNIRQVIFTGNGTRDVRVYTMIHTSDIIEQSIEEFMIEHEDFFSKNIIMKTRDYHNNSFNQQINKMQNEIHKYKSIYVENLIKYGENNA